MGWVFEMLNESQMQKQMFELLEPLLAEEYGLELVEVQWRREKDGWVLRLFIDAPSGDGRVALDTITEVSRHFGDFLDVEDIVKVPYRLEVSSPGFDRPLRKPLHFARHKGEKIKVKTMAKSGKKNFSGILLEADGEKIKIEMDGGEKLELIYDEIRSANLVYKWR